MLRPLALDLEERRAAARLGGGEEKIARQHDAGKLTARERIALLIDDGTFTELGIHARPHFSQRAMDGRDAPGRRRDHRLGSVDGRPVAVVAYDFTVMAGSMGMTGEIKVARLRELALTKRIPIVWLLDSAGARIQEAVGSLFAGTGHLFREEVVMSGVVPQVAALMGPCAAGTAYIPGLADFVPMVDGRGSMALAGPHLVRAAIGEDVTQEELGGARVHCRKSGVGDLEVADDEECIARDPRVPLVLPVELRGAAAACGAVTDPSTARDEELLDVLPESNRKPYDMYDVIRLIVDDGEWLDLKPQVGAHDHHLPGAHGRPPGRDRRHPAAAPRRHPRQRLRRQGRALRQPLRRVRDPARVPRRTCRASWSARRSRRRGSSATARRCCTRSPPRRCRRSRSCCARPTAPATT